MGVSSSRTTRKLVSASSELERRVRMSDCFFSCPRPDYVSFATVAVFRARVHALPLAGVGYAAFQVTRGEG